MFHSNKSNRRFIATVILLGSFSLGWPARGAQNGIYKTLYAFNATGDLSDGANPEAGVVTDRRGNVYGTTYFGGGGTGCERNYGGCGVVFKITPDGAETILHRFSGAKDGANPTSGLVLDPDGNVYGTTPYGGESGLGIVFRISADGEETIVHHFRGGRDGANPAAALVFDRAGNLYGTTQYGGRGCYGQGCGTVFEVRRDGIERILYRFRDGDDGSSPRGTVALDGDGNIYGVTWLGGHFSFGTIFMIVRSCHLNQEDEDEDRDELQDLRFKLLHAFTAGNDGANPIGGVIVDKEGNLYGLASAGGEFTDGTVFRLDAKRRFSVLHAFTGASDGANPYGSLILGPKGNLYGTAGTGGSAANAGAVYEISPQGTLQTFYDFVGDSSDGANPLGGVTLGSNGKLYGSLIQSGANGWGSVFVIEPVAPVSGMTSIRSSNEMGKLQTTASSDVQPDLLCHPRLSAPITVATPAERLAAGMRAVPPLTDGFAWPDAQLSAIRDGDRYLFSSIDAGFHARQRWHGLAEGNNNYGSVVITEGTLDNPLGSGAPLDISIQPNSDPQVNPHNCDPNAHPQSGCYTYIGGGPIYVVPPGKTGAGNWLLVSHAEYSNPDYYINGLAVSTDRGRHWTDIGEILRANMPFRYDGPSEPFAVGDGPLVISLDGRYFYLYFQDWLQDGSQTNVSVERALVDDVLRAAFGGPISHAAPFEKYYQGTWNQPGIGGLSSDLIPNARYGGGLNVAYSRFLHRYVMVDSDSQNYSYAESPDGLNWTNLTFLAMLGDYPNLAGYSGPVGLGEDPAVLGSSFYVYYTQFDGPWPTAQTVKRFTLSCSGRGDAESR